MQEYLGLLCGRVPSLFSTHVSFLWGAVLVGYILWVQICVSYLGRQEHERKAAAGSQTSLARPTLLYQAGLGVDGGVNRGWAG